METKTTVTPTKPQLAALLKIYRDPISGYARVNQAIYRRLVDMSLVKRSDGDFRWGAGNSSNSAVLVTAAGFEIVKRYLPPQTGEVVAALEGTGDRGDVARRLRFWGVIDDRFPREPQFGLAA